MSDVTTELAPITQRSPIVTPLVTTTPTPHHTLSPIRVGPLVVNPCHGTGLSDSTRRSAEGAQPQRNSVAYRPHRLTSSGQCARLEIRLQQQRDEEWVPSAHMSSAFEHVA